jgi:23S rRNA pseudouridine2605 synthase
MSESERLQKFLSRAGIASRRAAETLITEGKVLVNGKKVTTLGSKVDPLKDLVVVSGKPVTVSSERRWFVLYKPPGVVTTLKDPQGRPTVGDYVREVGSRVYPVGRLDYDAEGALLLTDDGDVANKLMHPKHQVARVYLAKVKGHPTDASLEKLVSGVRLEDGVGKATSASVFEKRAKNCWLKLVVTEGRQHFVKRLCAAIGHPVLRLFRPAHAGVGLTGIRPGQWRPLTHDEVRKVKAIADGAPSPAPQLKLPARRHGHAAPGFDVSDEADDDEA